MTDQQLLQHVQGIFDGFRRVSFAGQSGLREVGSAYYRFDAAQAQPGIVEFPFVATYEFDSGNSSFVSSSRGALSFEREPGEGEDFVPVVVASDEGGTVVVDADPDVWDSLDDTIVDVLDRWVDRMIAKESSNRYTENRMGSVADRMIREASRGRSIELVVESVMSNYFYTPPVSRKPAMISPIVAAGKQDKRNRKKGKKKNEVRG